MKRVREVMTEGVEVISPNDTIKAAAERMRDRDIGPVPVCDGERLVGMVTDRDLVVRGIAKGRDVNDKVADVMTHDVEWIHENATLDDAAEKMSTLQIRRLVVLDDNKRLVGIISLGDLAHEASAGTTARTLEEVTFPHEPAPR
jgi:CBS domain-containing protein